MNPIEPKVRCKRDLVENPETEGRRGQRKVRGKKGSTLFITSRDPKQKWEERKSDE